MAWIWWPSLVRTVIVVVTVLRHVIMLCIICMLWSELEVASICRYLLTMSLVFKLFVLAHKAKACCHLHNAILSFAYFCLRISFVWLLIHLITDKYEHVMCCRQLTALWQKDAVGLPRHLTLTPEHHARFDRLDNGKLATQLGGGVTIQDVQDIKSIAHRTQLYDSSQLFDCHEIGNAVLGATSKEHLWKAMYRSVFGKSADDAVKEKNPWVRLLSLQIKPFALPH